jgi:hemolysin III
MRDREKPFKGMENQPAAALPIQRYTRGEEIANALTHGLGIVLGVAALAVLGWFSCTRGTASHIVGCLVFGATLVFLYTASTLYHAVRHSRTKQILRVLDHSAIFLLIAGTYTPLTLVSLRGPWGWSLFGTIWGLALLGLVLQFTIRKRFPIVLVALYVAMGWAAVVAIRPLINALPASGLALLFGGGMAYTLGVVFYLWRSLRYHHAIWHLFVLAGSTMHFLAIFFSVFPPAVS